MTDLMVRLTERLLTLPDRVRPAWSLSPGTTIARGDANDLASLRVYQPIIVDRKECWTKWTFIRIIQWLFDDAPGRAWPFSLVLSCWLQLREPK